MTSGHAVTTQPTDERVCVVVGGETLADSVHAVLLHETGLPTRYYLPRADVRMEWLVPTDTKSMCPFKGDAVYWSARVDGHEVRDVAWSYPAPIPERAEIAGLVCFFAERVDELTVNGAPVERPDTPWSTAAEVDQRP